MRIALALLCFGAVAFMLRVLLALAQEAMHAARGRKFYLTRVDSGGQHTLTEPNPLAIRELRLAKGIRHSFAFQTAPFPEPVTEIARRGKQEGRFNLRRL